MLAEMSEAKAQAGAAGWFDQLVNALNRLPRPLMALGAIALLVHAMADPAGFALRMQGLRAMPQELWWLTGGVITFYFGARVSHYRRSKAEAAPKDGWGGQPAASAPRSRAPTSL